MAIIPISARGDAPGQWGHKPKAIIANLAHRDTSDPVVNGVNKNSLMNTFNGFSQQHYQVHSVE
jgi:aromatic ring-opening dioxygenase catalytic subunit (LigB family)